MISPAADAASQPVLLPEELLASTAFLLARLGTAIKMRAIEEFEQEGFSLPQYGVLAILGEETARRRRRSPTRSASTGASSSGYSTTSRSAG